MIVGHPAGYPIAPGYEVLAHVRRGSELDCYEVWSSERYCRCFAKTPRPDRVGHPSTLRHLRREARLLVRLSHPHLVRGYELATPDGGPPVLVTENLTGATLSWLLDTHGRLGAADLAHLGLHLCSALRYLHGRGTLHLDVKPSNVVAAEGVAKLIDLSLARAPGRCAPGYGTIGYLSPEQVLGARVGPAADVWGLGVVLYEAATGVRVFEPRRGDPGFRASRGSRLSESSRQSARSALSRYEAVLMRPARRLRAHRRLPVEVAAVIDACLTLRPADRPTLADLADALERLTS